MTRRTHVLTRTYLRLAFLTSLPFWATGLTGCGSDGGADDDGFTVDAGDCDDNDPNTYPDAPELCDGKDNNCDNEIERVATYYPDTDGDGAGGSANTQQGCSLPAGFVEESGDCDDGNAAISPLAAEICDGLDNNCNTTIDEGVLDLFYPDEDEDGYGPLEAAVQACTAPKDYVDRGGDCDDADDETHPGALELCDKKDNNCDGATEDGSDQPYFEDNDEDGFGSDNDIIESCGAPAGYVEAMGDCDDGDSSIHPGAVDVDNDDVDQDCGGTDAPQPHVGFETSEYGRLQDAVLAADDGDTVWVAPGAYPDRNINLEGKALTLAGTHGAYSTIVNANNLGRGLVFDSREDTDTVVMRLTITGGTSTAGGGGIYVFQSSPTLDQLIVQNSNAANGGGSYLENASPVITLCRIRNNEAANGGGMFLTADASTGQVTDPTISDTQITGNSVLEGFGGGVYLNGARGEFTRTSIRNNSALGYGSLGGGLYVLGSSPLIEASLIAGNLSNGAGGGIYVDGSSPILKNVTVAGNRADSHGGGVYVIGSSSVTGISNAILALNAGENLYNDTTAPGTVTFTNSLLYNWNTDLNHNLASLDASIVVLPPEFASFTNDNTDENDDYHLVPSSAAADAGTGTDPDGSSADLGAFGGSEADWSYYRDLDQDDMYDGWERIYELELDGDDASDDPDQDGLANFEEFFLHTSPLSDDTDNDGADDGSEESQGSDPADWYSQPGVDGVAEAVVPDHFDSVGAALEAVQYNGRIRVEQGLYDGNLVIANKRVTLEGASASEVSLLADRGTILTAVWAHLEMSGFTITGGLSLDYGGGMHLRGVTGDIGNLVLTANSAVVSGGGIHMALVGPELRFHSSTVTANLSNETGGGISLEKSSPQLDNLQVFDNVAGLADEGEEGDGNGPGLFMSDSAPLLRNDSFIHNSVYVGQNSTPDIVNSTFAQSIFGVRVVLSSPTLANCAFSDNNVGLSIDNSATSVITLKNSILAFNKNYNVFVDSGVPQPTAGQATFQVTYNDLYAPPGSKNHNLGVISETNLTVDPLFQVKDRDGSPNGDFHVSVSSPVVGTGEGTNVDGTSADMGAFGGAYGDLWDLDADGYPNYFWSGTLTDAPSGFNENLFDCNDIDPSSHNCN